VNLYIYAQVASPFNLDGSPVYVFSRSLIFIDADNNSATGYLSARPTGSDYVINGDSLFSLATGSVFTSQFVRGISAQPLNVNNQIEFSIPLSSLTVTPNQIIKLIFLNDELNDYAPEPGFSISYQIVGN